MTERGDFWNYRVVRVKDGDDFFFQIHEAHYAADQREEKRPIPHSLTKDPVTVGSETGAGIQNVLTMMQRALILPVIDFDTIQPIDERVAVMAGK